MQKNNWRKSKQLDQPYGTACNRLRKMLLFDCVQKLGLDTCYQCGSKIEHIADFSVEHKQAWQEQDDPKSFFFDLQNVAFSHLSCNVGAAKKVNTGHMGEHGAIARYSSGCRCTVCRAANALEWKGRSLKVNADRREKRKKEYHTGVV